MMNMDLNQIMLYENNLILDKYLVDMYGIEYARQYPLMKITK